ncbi:putative actin-fragmin kinase DDB_G0287957 [Condylostylus longicornis]|uniref:putative actin-fragmin kinase DDB_G0287957 n=1 Tax=Condylostylus longicornis TaxID=2530218 RepID=UPI00244DDA08|nr:putative actin-fragmin kinase DDB_G0287957 [Condylostylus longicornis]
MSLAAITLKDLIGEARSVPIFTGQDAYSLKSFIEEVESLIALAADADAKNYLYRILVDSMYLRTKNVTTLEDAYRSLLETNISDSKVPNTNSQYRNNNHTNYRNNHNINSRHSSNNTNSRNNYRNANRTFNNNNYNNNIRNTYTNRPMDRNYTTNEKFRNFRPNQQFGGTGNNLPGPSYNENRSSPIPMDVDSDLFYKEGDRLTCVKSVKHQIITTASQPIYSKIYRFPKIHEEEVNKQVQEMLEQNIIQPSSSPYNSPIWVVPKKLDYSGKQKWRIVIDYRKLNEITVDDKFPIPNIDSIFDKLGRAQYFTTLDLAKGFHQILVDEKDRLKTAFSTPQEKELLAIVWATKYFRPYLYGTKFLIRTDHQPLKWLHSLKEPNAKLQRWRIRLNEYDFEIDYVKGKENRVADFLSRMDSTNNEINHIDDPNETPSNNSHLMVQRLNDRNATTIIQALRNRFALFGRPDKIVVDNEFDSLNIKNFFRTENINAHFTSPRSHTGNSTIERAHGTLSEHLRILDTQKSHLTPELENTLAQIENNIYNTFNQDNTTLKQLQIQIEKTRHNIKTLLPHRQKRGLINLGGKILKWLFGNLDDDDKTEIVENIKLIEQGNYNSIQTINKQIKINDQFQKNLNILQKRINENQEILNITLREQNNTFSKSIKSLQFLSSYTNINLLNSEIDKVQQNILFAKHGIMTHSILSNEEIDEFEIDVFKYKEIKSSLISLDNNIIFAILIPNVAKELAVGYKIIPMFVKVLYSGSRYAGEAGGQFLFCWTGALFRDWIWQDL